jgi:hypothetical protein
MTDNLRAVIWPSDDNSRAVIIHFQARQHAEKIAFRVRTTARILSHFWELPQLKEGTWLMLGESSQDYEYRVCIDQTFLDSPFIVGMEIESESEPVDCVAEVSVHEDLDVTASLIYIEPHE